ncbi:polyprenyl diphosphate synthase [Enterobacteriaceae endosymbiont of Macroplea appendiculata]|uniref:polyprenyl diphosphate synthase n=1 Tax=Enterobacteriaceae endosymbiont of Macroplea appendiculata TaxID=2675790 RepID=UPI001B3B0879|nr:polyprenyl diphosphate synthase [Enterobacteriaceae endosymbiont of Macroplea appendiculata]
MNMQAINILNKKKCPQHIAIIMDGNRRWAQKQGKKGIIGHKAGVNVVKTIIHSCIKYKLKVLTLYAFSSENWKRSPSEIIFIMKLFKYILNNEINNFIKYRIKINVIGDKTVLDTDLQKSIIRAEKLTKHNHVLIVNLAINYGGKSDIIYGIKNIIKQVYKKKITIQDITEKTFTKYLALHDVPPIDLVIRTGGNIRISNFFIWQIAYAELYFTNILWPDFNEKCFLHALENYCQRQRRFGGNVAI